MAADCVTDKGGTIDLLGLRYTGGRAGEGEW